MQNILLISDTHGYLEPAILKYIEQADQVWHAGDIGSRDICTAISAVKPLKAVFGNIDGQELRSDYPEDLIFDCEQVKVLITHIAGYPGNYTPRVKGLIKMHKPKLLICGHSHILKVMNDQQFGHLHMNPGACGVHGFHIVKTALRFQIDGTQIKNLSVIELGKRTSVPS